MQARRIGLLGAGNMAGALIRGLLASGTVTPAQIRASDVRRERLEQMQTDHGIETSTSNVDVVRWADVLVLAVKPQVLGSVLDEVAGEVAEDTTVISLAAGVPCAFIQARLPAGSRIVRSMPNTPALVLRGATAVTAGSHATEADVHLAVSLFNAVGRTVVVPETLMDAVTGLSGSGPAYVMLMIEGLADGGVRAGLPRDAALLLAAQTVLGAAQLLVETGEHPGKLKDMVTSPGGTTIHGLGALEAAGVRHAMMAAVDAATRRAGELGALMSVAAKKS
ncbi:MAG: pyrroline-5-carboxylate reductase [Polyangiaceae bacterium]|nr:pyrroline-5-carboxylate reductase [Polyangiaceae bacterium]